MSVRTTLLHAAVGFIEQAEDAMQTIGYEEYPDIQDRITELLSLLDEAILDDAEDTPNYETPVESNE